MSVPPADDVEFAIAGAGFSGIGIAIELQRAGMGDFAVIEAGHGVGGAWHWNRYPGVAVDIEAAWRSARYPMADYTFTRARDRVDVAVVPELQGV